MGSAFTQSIAQDNLHIEAHIGGGMGVEQVVAIVVAVVVAYFTAGAASGLIAEAFSASAGSFMGAAAAATSTTAAVSAGLGNVMLSSAIAGMASSATSQLITTGKINGGQALKAGLVGGLTAGIAGGLSNAIGGTPGTALAGTGTMATSSTTSLGSRIVGALEQAAASSIAQSVVYGKGGESSFTSSLLASAAAFGANTIGAQDWGEAGRALAHAGLGCAVAAAGGKDCGSGALGGATSSLVGSRLDPLINTGDQRLDNILTESINLATTGLVTIAAGKDVNTALSAAQNEDENNRQLHNQEIRLAKQLANTSDGKYTVSQVADAMRNATNNKLGEKPWANSVETDVVNHPEKVFDYKYGAQWLPGQDASGKATILSQQLTGHVDPQLAAFIQANTGNTYSWSPEALGLVKPQPQTAPPVYDGRNYNSPEMAAGLNSLLPIDRRTNDEVMKGQQQLGVGIISSIATLGWGGGIVASGVTSKTPWVIGGAAISGGSDAAGQYVQNGTVRPAQTIVATGLGGLMVPTGVALSQTTGFLGGFVGNTALGAANSVLNSGFQNAYYGDQNSLLYSGLVGGGFGALGYSSGALAESQTGKFYPVYKSSVPALFQPLPSTAPANWGFAIGNFVNGAGSFFPSKSQQQIDDYIKNIAR